MLGARDQGETAFLPARDGVQIPVRFFGSDGTRRPVVMTHGLESHSGWFVQSGAFMAGLGHPVYLVDRRGSGRSRELRGHCNDFHEWSRDLEDVARAAMKRNGTDKVHVAGHCFGALPAAVFTIDHPDMVASLLLPTPGFITTADLTLPQKFRVLGDHLTGRSGPLPVPLQTEQFTDDEGLRAFIRNDELKLHEATSTLYWNVNRARRFVRSRRGGIRCPVWAGLAGRDEIVRTEPTKRFIGGFGSEEKRIIVFPEAKHILEFSPARAAFFGELKSWLHARES